MTKLLLLAALTLATACSGSEFTPSDAAAGAGGSAGSAGLGGGGGSAGAALPPSVPKLACSLGHLSLTGVEGPIEELALEVAAEAMGDGWELFFGPFIVAGEDEQQSGETTYWTDGEGRWASRRAFAEGRRLVRTDVLTARIFYSESAGGGLPEAEPLGCWAFVGGETVASSP